MLVWGRIAGIQYLASVIESDPKPPSARPETVVVLENVNPLDAVNIAAWLEALAEPGICVSGTVRDHIGTRLPLSFTDLGSEQVKYIAQPIPAYHVRSDISRVTPVLGSSLPLPNKPSIAVLLFQNVSGDPEQEYFADGMVG